MHLMQYEIELPPGYDIRKRIEVRGQSTDEYPDLGLKACCITDTHYSPFYFWRRPGGMNRFLFRDGGFQHIVNDFGRPPVQHWMGQDPGNDAERPGLFASATGIDPRGWQFVEFSLWEDEPPADAEGVRYEIGHLSIPELGKL